MWPGRGQGGKSGQDGITVGRLGNNGKGGHVWVRVGRVVKVASESEGCIGQGDVRMGRGLMGESEWEGRSRWGQIGKGGQVGSELEGWTE